MEDLSGLPELTPHQQMQVNSHLSGELFLDKDALGAFVGQAKEPFAYLKLLYGRPALPLFSGMRPYGQLPYAFALLSGAPGAEPFIYIAPPGIDPGSAFTEQLIAKVGSFPTVLIFGHDAEAFPGLDAVHANTAVINLYQPFAERMIYHPGFASGQSLAEITGFQSPGMVPDKAGIKSDIMAGMRYLALADALEGEAYTLELEEIKRYALQSLGELASLHRWFIKMV